MALFNAIKRGWLLKDFINGKVLTLRIFLV